MGGVLGMSHNPFEIAADPNAAKVAQAFRDLASYEGKQYGTGFGVTGDHRVVGGADLLHQRVSLLALEHVHAPGLRVGARGRAALPRHPAGGRLLERTGMGARGSITALYTVLAEDESGGDPIAEEVRGILDGHMILSRRIAAKNQYPAIDVLGSLSRVMTQIVPAEHVAMAATLRRLMAKYDEVEMLLQVGEYKAGSDPLAEDWLMVPASVLIAFGFASFGMGITSYMKTFQQMDWINFIMLPMFLFSATFYPLSVYPQFIQWLICFQQQFKRLIVKSRSERQYGKRRRALGCSRRG